MKKTVTIQKPRIRTAKFKIIGTAPLVINRFPKELVDDLDENQQKGTTGRSRRNRRPVVPEYVYNRARYISREGWDGWNASALRCGMIQVCRLVDYPMTKAKMTIFTLADGYDKLEPWIPLVRIYGKPIMHTGWGRTTNGTPHITHRPMYNNWHSFVRIRWDVDQFTIDEVASLLVRVGFENGLGEGRPYSRDSAGCGWGTFQVEGFEI